MKSISVFLLSGLLVLLSSCEQQAKIDELQAKVDSLQTTKGNLDAQVAQYLADFNEIQSNLNEIKKKQDILEESANNKELTQDSKTQIQNDLMAINKLMADNKQKLASLQKRLNASTGENTELKKMIDGLQARIQQQQTEIAAMKNQLAMANEQIADLVRTTDSLAIQNAVQSTEIEEKTIALNTAFYAIGTFKELKDAEVIDPGGLFKRRSGAQLSDDANKGYFTKIDTRNVDEIPINDAKKIQLATSHPTASYKKVSGDNGVKSLKITDKEAFWSQSKYLVIILR